MKCAQVTPRHTFYQAYIRNWNVPNRASAVKQPQKRAVPSKRKNTSPTKSKHTVTIKSFCFEFGGVHGIAEGHLTFATPCDWASLQHRWCENINGKNVVRNTSEVLRRSRLLGNKNFSEHIVPNNKVQHNSPAQKAASQDCVVKSKLSSFSLPLVFKWRKYDTHTRFLNIFHSALW